jgi:hypothetical protein
MADSKITALTALTAADPVNDMFPVVDVSDTTMAASGTTKKISVNNILGASGTATLASASITGDLTVDTSTLKVDSTNNRVGIVQATPLYPLHLVGEFGLEEASSGNGTKLRFIGDASKYNFRLGKQLTATNTFEITPSTAIGGTTFSNPVYTVTYNGIHTFLDGAGGTRMTLDASGNLLVGLTVDTFAPAKGVSMFAGNSSRVAVGHANGTSSGDYYHSFAYNSTVIGSITQSGTTAVLYNTTSDYRLKESVKPLNGGLARVNALKPSIYNWKSDGSTGEGFLAHELAEVVPFAVSGEKDAMNADGTIKSQGIDMSRVVPILVAAIQELTAEVNALKNA